MVNDIFCPKCKKAVFTRKSSPDLKYWNIHCNWCGFDFRKAKTYVKAKDRKWIEGGN